MSRIIAHNVKRLRSLGISCSVRPADAAENEINAFYFTSHDPTTRQPEELKKNSEIKTMLANVRPNCGNALLHAVLFTDDIVTKTSTMVS